MDFESFEGRGQAKLEFLTGATISYRMIKQNLPARLWRGHVEILRAQEVVVVKQQAEGVSINIEEQTAEQGGWLKNIDSFSFLFLGKKGQVKATRSVWDIPLSLSLDKLIKSTQIY